MIKRKTYCFDIDGTICINTFGEYEKATPFVKRINMINKLYDEGHIIKFLTARGSSTGIDWRELTQSQLDKWGVKYNTLDLGKIDADVFVDDKGLNAEVFFNSVDDLYLKEHIDTLLETFSEELKEKIWIVSNHILNAFENNSKLIMAGNGKSYLNCLHMSEELNSKFMEGRKDLPSIVLCSEDSLLKSFSNAYEYNKSLLGELNKVGKHGDVFIGISKRGKSKNILNCFKEAKKNGLFTIFLTSKQYNQDLLEIDVALKVESSTTSIIQEIHIIILNLIFIALDKSYHSN